MGYHPRYKADFKKLCRMIAKKYVEDPVVLWWSNQPPKLPAPKGPAKFSFPVDGPPGPAQPPFPWMYIDDGNQCNGRLL